LCAVGSANSQKRNKYCRFIGLETAKVHLIVNVPAIGDYFAISVLPHLFSREVVNRYERGVFGLAMATSLRSVATEAGRNGIVVASAPFGE